MENRSCSCKRCDIVAVLMEFGNITKEEAENKVNEILKRKKAKQEENDHEST